MVQHDDRLLMNPGSATGAYSIYTDAVIPSFMLLDISGSKVDVYIYQMIDGESKVKKMEFVKPTPRTFPKGPKEKFKGAVHKVVDSTVSGSLTICLNVDPCRGLSQKVRPRRAQTKAQQITHPFMSQGVHDGLASNFSFSLPNS